MTDEDEDDDQGKRFPACASSQTPPDTTFLNNPTPSI